MCDIDTVINRKKCINLTTFRKDGTRVATPIWYIWKNAKLYMFSEENAWKLKRIANNPNVELIPCNYFGNLRGKYLIEGIATIIADEKGEEILKDMKKKYPFMYRIVVKNHKRYRFFEIIPIKINKRE